MTKFGRTTTIWCLFAGALVCATSQYHRGGAGKPKPIIATWEGYKNAGPLVISTNRPGPADGTPVRVFHSDVAIKLVGSDTWLLFRHRW
jgi:hypothetical protein